ncbi:MAG: hypothetical protein AAFU65_12520 [Pseudomonadota bacterium]
MTTVVIDTSAATANPASLSTYNLIAYSNALATLAPIIAATQQSVDTAPANLATWSLLDVWRSGGNGGQVTVTFASPEVIDTVAFYAHNLATTGGTVQVEYSTDGGASWDDFVAATAVSASGPWMAFAPGGVLAAMWRLTFTGTAPTEIGNLFVGRAMELPYPPGIGFTPPPLGRQHRIETSISGNGRLLDRALSREITKTRISLPYVSGQWARSTWNAFRAHAERFPFYYSWCHDDYPGDAAFCYSDGNVPPAPFSAIRLSSIDLNCFALTE